MRTIKAKTEEEARKILTDLTLGEDFWEDEFDGMNCGDFENFCLGWDGVDRRCECGNRRVSWEITVLDSPPDENGNLTWYAYGSAW